MRINDYSNMGTNPTVRLTGNDKVGTILLTTGIGVQGPVSNSVMNLQLTEGTASNVPLKVTVYSLNSTALALVIQISLIIAVQPANVPEISISLLQLADSTTYQFAYKIGD